MTVIPQDAYTGAEGADYQAKEFRELENSTFDPSLKLEKIGSYDQAEKIEAVFTDLIDHVEEGTDLVVKLSPESVLNQANMASESDAFSGLSRGSKGEITILPDKRI